MKAHNMNVAKMLLLSLLLSSSAHGIIELSERPSWASDELNYHKCFYNNNNHGNIIPKNRVCGHFTGTPGYVYTCTDTNAYATRANGFTGWDYDYETSPHWIGGVLIPPEALKNLDDSSKEYIVSFPDEFGGKLYYTAPAVVGVCTKTGYWLLSAPKIIQTASPYAINEGLTPELLIKNYDDITMEYTDTASNNVRRQDVFTTAGLTGIEFYCKPPKIWNKEKGKCIDPNTSSPEDENPPPSGDNTTEKTIKQPTYTGKTKVPNYNW